MTPRGESELATADFAGRRSICRPCSYLSVQPIDTGYDGLDRGLARLNFVLLRTNAMIQLPDATTFWGRILRFPLRCVPRDRVMRVLTGPLAGARWISSSGTHGCWLGSYERDLQRLLIEHLRPGDVFFDIGANVGFFSLVGSRLVGPSGKVYSFEPLPRNLNYLRRHIELNRIENVTVLPVAVADAPGNGFFTESPSASQGSLGVDGLNVQLVSLDTSIASGDLPTPRLLKIDVEGAESRVLAGARDLLTRARPLIMLSTHGRQQHEACWSLLTKVGYELRLRRDGRLDGQYELIAIPASGESRGRAR